MRKVVAALLVILLAGLFFSALSSDPNSETVANAELTRQNVDDIDKLYSEQKYDEIDNEIFELSEYVGDQLYKLPDGMAKIALEDSLQYIDYVTEQIANQDQSATVPELLIRIDASLAAAHTYQALDVLDARFSDENRELVNDQLKSARVFTEGVIGLVDEDGDQVFAEVQLTVLDSNISNIANNDGSANIDIRGIRNSQIAVLEEAGGGAIGMVPTMDALMTSIRDDFVRNDFEASRDNMRRLTSLLQPRYNDAVTDSRLALGEVLSQAAGYANSITAESQTTSAELDQLFSEISRAMALYEAERSTRPDLNTDPRLVGVFMKAASDHAGQIDTFLPGTLSDTQLQSINTLNTTAVLLLQDGASAASSENAQSVYEALHEANNQL